MHKLRNTRHKEILEALYEKYHERKRISKKQLRILLSFKKWEAWRVEDLIESDLWGYYFVDD
jgi:hypothetical protein